MTQGGVSNSGRSLPRTYVEPGLNPTAVGISMKWWSQSLDGKCTCGVLSTAQPIRDAARTMKEIEAGFLPVAENDRLIGMVTDHDITVRAVSEGKGPDTPVRDVVYCFEDDDFCTSRNWLLGFA